MSDRLEIEVPVLTAEASMTLAREDAMLGIGQPNSVQLGEINKRMPLVGDLAAEDLFVWAIQAGNSLTHAYYMWLDESSLRRMAAGANAGRGYPYLRNHNHYSDPHGRVYGAVLREDGSIPLSPAVDGVAPLARDVLNPGGKLVRLFEAVYIPRGLTVNGIANDDLIRNLETGVQASVSLGLGLYNPTDPGARVLCDIDGADMFRSDWDLCPHFPGSEYEIMLGKGDDAKKTSVISTGRVVNAGQNEVSGVYLGAVPDTFTERGRQLFAAGLLGMKDARRIEDDYRLARGTIAGDRQTIVDIGRKAPVADTKNGRRPGKVDGSGPMSGDEMLARVRELLAGNPGRLAALELHDPDADPLNALVRALDGEVETERRRAEELTATHAEWKRREAEWLELSDGETVDAGRKRKDELAKLGEAMFEKAVDEYLRQRTRAGLTADENAKAMAKRMTPSEIEAETLALKTAADRQYGPGRATEPTLEPRHPEKGTPVRRRALQRV